MRTLDLSMEKVGKYVFTAAIFLFVTGCADTLHYEKRGLSGKPRMNMLACPPSPPRVCVDIVFLPFTDGTDTFLCPVYTVAANKLNAIADVDKAVNGQRVLWRAVDSSGNAISDVEFGIFFDPFVGKTDSQNGEFTSPVLADPPEGVLFKYTITGGENCDPLDPMIRISQ